MMRLSNLADYAVVLMCTAARQCGAMPLQAAKLAEQSQIPGPTVQKLVSSLARAGLLVASRGSGGGVRLARPAAAINLADIIEAVEGPIALTSCVEPSRHECAIQGNCKVQPHWAAVNGAVRGALADISIASLLDAAPEPETTEISGPAPLSPNPKQAAPQGQARIQI